MHLIRQLEEVFGQKPLELQKIPDFTDAALARVCHNLPLTCGLHGCLDDWKGLKSEADRYYCQAFSGSQVWEFLVTLSYMPDQTEYICPAGRGNSLALGHGAISEGAVCTA